MDLGELYADAQGRVIDLVTPLSAPSLATLVPGTPQWTIEQLVAHLTGVAADLIDGKVDGAATEPWTSRQISERQGRPLGDVLAEWRRRSPELLAMLETPGQVDAAAFDILTHEHDLRGALGLAGPSDPSAVRAVTGRVTQRVSHLVGAAELPALRLVCHDGGTGAGVGAGVRAGDGDGGVGVGVWVCGSGEVAVTGTAPTMEWFRALFGRRSASQIRTYDWDGDPAPYFELLNLFGPLPAADVAEAGAPAPQ